MAVTRKAKPIPATDTDATPQPAKRAVTVPTAIARQDDQPLVSVLLRLPPDMLARIDASVLRRRPVRISRQSWIIEALQAQLANDPGKH